MPFSFLAIGVGGLALWIVVVCLVSTALRNPNRHIDRTVTDPILLDGWDLPPK